MLSIRAQRIGVYGGSFDPIHYGHLAIAEEARVVLELDQVLFVPAARQPLKDQAQSEANDRLRMVQLACQDHPGFMVDDLELRRPPPSYTADTLATLHERFGPATQFWFILGADAANELPRWQRLTQILELAHLAVVGRPRVQFDLAALQAIYPQFAERVVSIDGPQLEISSSDLRRRLAAGLPVRYQLPEVVRAYIADHGLYQT
ncbi:MAG: nicotinate-nucleotide adenylyltransferase [Oscillochloridaceae bacterium umkhey_bin13]